jgi:hypothetical protein
MSAGDAPTLQMPSRIKTAGKLRALPVKAVAPSTKSQQSGARLARNPVARPFTDEKECDKESEPVVEKVEQMEKAPVPPSTPKPKEMPRIRSGQSEIVFAPKPPKSPKAKGQRSASFKRCGGSSFRK